MKEFQQQWTFEQVQVMVADSALYSEDNLQSLGELPWICRVPATLTQAKQLLQAQAELEWVPSSQEGYRIAQQHSNYGGIEQWWLIVERVTNATLYFFRRLLKSVNVRCAR